ncbi:MAG: hypothetical protein E2591_00580 [Achromobacter sp.]|uniref:hypothetical protein n=1 Tax=Achromobacter sp. TaxID=134375 RepID=UPI0012D1444B|nr:hypothetical protein [Achromobacter sp.]
MEKPEISNSAAVAILVAVAFAIVFVVNLPSDRLSWEGWAGLAQAVLSVGAVIAAIEISRKQNQHALRRDLEHEAREQVVLLESIAVELKTSLETFNAQISRRITDDVPLSAGWRFSSSESSFPVYRALVSRIAIVPDQALRVSILKIYSFANALLLKLSLHNTLINEQDELLFRMASASTRKAEASPIDLDDVLVVEDVLTIGLSPYEALRRQLEKVKAQLNDVSQQINDAVPYLEKEVPRITDRIASLVSSLDASRAT